MRHRVRGSKLGRTVGARRALFRNLAESLVLHGRIRTTVAKAKAVRSLVEGSVTLAKQGGLTSIRRLRKDFPPRVVDKLVKEIGPRYQAVSGGYTRIVAIGERAGDGARMALLELREIAGEGAMSAAGAKQNQRSSNAKAHPSINSG